jgi:hypothetical protein
MFETKFVYVTDGTAEKVLKIKFITTVQHMKR